MVIYIFIDMHHNSISVSSWSVIFLQSKPLHSPQAGAHSRPCFLQLHLLLLQSPLQLQLIASRRWSGAGLRSVVIGIIPLAPIFHPQTSEGSLIPIHSWTWWYTWRLCYWYEDEVGGKLWGCTKVVLDATFWEKRIVFNRSPCFSLYKQTSAFSPAAVMHELCHIRS